jgi:hypothetical protein
MIAITEDKKMFAPMRHREAIAPEDKVHAILGRYDAARGPADLAQELAVSGLAVGTLALLTKRVGQMLESLEEAGRAERTPDGRFRAIRAAKRS